MGRIALALLVALSVPACGGSDEGDGEASEEEDKDKKSDPRVLVDAVPVGRGSVGDHLATTGTLEGEAQADIVPEATGIVREILVEEGDPVRRGQVLAILANPSLDAGADRAGVEIERARREAARTESLHGQGAVSDRELLAAREALRTAEATLLEATRTHGFTRLTSPIDGVVSARDVRVGELAGGRRAFQVVDALDLRVVVRLSEKDLPRIRTGQAAVLEGAYDALSRASGTVERISPVVDPATGTVRVQVSVDAGQQALRPGQFVKVRIEVDRHEGVLTIPRRALVWEDGEPVAWKVAEAKPEEADEEEKPDEAPWWKKLWPIDEDEDEGDLADAADPVPQRRAAKVRLTTGFLDPDSVEVVQGLAEGDLVVTEGNAALREDTPIRLPGDPPPAAADADDDEDKEPSRAEG